MVIVKWLLQILLDSNANAAEKSEWWKLFFRYCQKCFRKKEKMLSKVFGSTKNKVVLIITHLISNMIICNHSLLLGRCSAIPCSGSSRPCSWSCSFLVLARSVCLSNSVPDTQPVGYRFRLPHRYCFIVVRTNVMRCATTLNRAVASSPSSPQPLWPTTLTEYGIRGTARVMFSSDLLVRRGNGFA